MIQYQKVVVVVVDVYIYMRAYIKKLIILILIKRIF